MSSARESNDEGSLNAYEQQRLANIARNKQKLQSVHSAKAAMNTSVEPSQPKKRRKKTHQRHDVPTGTHNLRPRIERNSCGIANEELPLDTNCEAAEDILCDNEDLNTNTKRKGRGITRLDDIFSRTPNMSKIKIELNEFGQPVGEDGRTLSSAIGCQVRRIISVGCDDWRLVDPNKKMEVWKNIKEIYDVDAAAFKWFLATAGVKWKEFKFELKKKHFDDTLTDEELLQRNDGRVTYADWKYLIGYWRSSKFNDRSAKAKQCRANVRSLHTCGSLSYASSRHKLGKELGRPARRDEVFIKTHTRKNGRPLSEAAATINELKATVLAHPELIDRTIQQGDLYASVCGEKEPKGRVRVLGLGPNPQEVGTPGLKSYIPTRIQMEVLARKNAESEKETLKERVRELEEMLQERSMRESQNVESPTSRYGSNSQRQEECPRSQELADEPHHNAPDEEDNEDFDPSEEENLLPQRHNTTPSMQILGEQFKQRSLLAKKHSTAPSMPTISPTPSVPDDRVGETVILYAILRSDVPVAKGVVASTDPNNLVGGQPLGKECCEVIVNVVIKRDAVLPRPYDNMECMADAHLLSIAWPYNRLKSTKGASKPCHAASKPSHAPASKSCHGAAGLQRARQ